MKAVYAVEIQGDAIRLLPATTAVTAGRRTVYVPGGTLPALFEQLERQKGDELVWWRDRLLPLDGRHGARREEVDVAGQKAILIVLDDRDRLRNTPGQVLLATALLGDKARVGFAEASMPREAERQRPPRPPESPQPVAKSSWLRMGLVALLAAGSGFVLRGATWHTPAAPAGPPAWASEQPPESAGPVLYPPEPVPDAGSSADVAAAEAELEHRAVTRPDAGGHGAARPDVVVERAAEPAAPAGPSLWRPGDPDRLPNGTCNVNGDVIAGDRILFCGEYDKSAGKLIRRSACANGGRCAEVTADRLHEFPPFICTPRTGKILLLATAGGRPAYVDPRLAPDLAELAEGWQGACDKAPYGEALPRKWL